jgi:hypothetical protein
MVYSLAHLKGRSLQARDGIIGKVHDVFFDETDWIARYVEVDMGSMLNKRSVLISPGAVDPADWGLSVLPVNLTMEQVQSSPEIDTDLPVTRQHEATLREHFGWPAYWGALSGVGGLITPILGPMGAVDAEPSRAEANEPAQPAPDSHLRSANDTLGYHVQATDGTLGHVDEFLLDDEVWRIRYLVIDTRNWLPGRKVLVAPAWLHQVDWKAEKVHVGLTRDAIKASPAYDPAAHWSAMYSAQLHEHYQRPHYADWENSETKGSRLENR